MKRMNEVFELPVSSRAFGSVYAVSLASGVHITTASTYTAHAINHVDALADVLEAAIPSLQYNRSISDKADKLYLDAVLALNAYRGAK